MNKFTTDQFVNAVAKEISQQNLNFTGNPNLKHKDMLIVGYAAMAAKRLDDEAELLLVQQCKEDIQPQFLQTDVMRWVEFEKQRPPLNTLVASYYADRRVDAGEFLDEEDIDRHMQTWKPIAWTRLHLPPIA